MFRSVFQNENHVNESPESEAGGQERVSVFVVWFQSADLLSVGGCCFMLSQKDAGKMSERCFERQHFNTEKMVPEDNYTLTAAQHVT